MTEESFRDPRESLTQQRGAGANQRDQDRNYFEKWVLVSKSGEEMQKRGTKGPHRDLLVCSWFAPLDHSV